jgi:hypothetical protein
MTVIYGDATYHLTADVVTVESAGQPPFIVDPQGLPLPVARVLASLRGRAT